LRKRIQGNVYFSVLHSAYFRVVDIAKRIQVALAESFFIPETPEIGAKGFQDLLVRSQWMKIYTVKVDYFFNFLAVI
jgi:hypothetical protein